MLAYPAALRKAVEETEKSWKKFCALPVEVKKGLPYSNGGAGVGYEIKDGSGNKGDRKENFDVTVEAKNWLAANSKVISNPVVLDFLEKAIALVSLIKPTVVDFAEQSESAFSLRGFAEEVSASDKAFFVRFIHYFDNREVGDETASAHVDQSGFTLHLFEDAPGFQILTPGKKWINLPITAGETLIIPSMQMQLRSGSELKATCHRVVATPETAQKGRYSSVCFVQLKDTPKYDKDAHGRLQEKAQGFNYDMKPEAFAGLFKK